MPHGQAGEEHEGNVPLILLKASIAVLVALMGVRAFQSGTTWDRFLGSVLLVGLLLLFLAPKLVAVG